MSFSDSVHPGYDSIDLCSTVCSKEMWEVSGWKGNLMEYYTNYNYGESPQTVGAPFSVYQLYVYSNLCSFPWYYVVIKTDSLRSVCYYLS